MSRADSGRIIHLNKARERAKEDAEKQRKKIEEDRARAAAGITDKFTVNVSAVEHEIRTKTVGLVTLSQMKESQKDAVVHREAEVVKSLSESKKKGKSKEDIKESKEEVAQKRILSFAGDDDEEEEEVFIPKKRLGMDPSVDTSFLPDRERELALEKRKEDLAREWQAQQELEKNEEITVAFAYWDGSSHRKSTKMKKGHTISQFLIKAIECFKKEFSELRTCTPENMMFIKEDLIIPQHYTFQDFIVTKAMGKTGPLWQFDASADIRIRQDPDAMESHPAKVVLRSWYEKNKHIYPASRWEPFVPKKVYKHEIDDLETI
ncbi:unnamed protein product, partial [Mesorhabditis belari]|uniref:Protein FAM50 homolog n=1 Tax=Mesorhabditis belari TaxID=2138241 RepID=A0AAF3EFW0_9BILA